MGVIHFLEGLAVTGVAGHIADKQNHGRGVLECGVHPNRGVGSPRAARDKADARAASQLALSLGHEGRPTLLAAGHKSELIAVQVKAIEHRQVTLTGHPESMGNALGQEAFNKQVASNF